MQFQRPHKVIVREPGEFIGARVPRKALMHRLTPSGLREAIDRGMRTRHEDHSVDSGRAA